MAGLAHKLYTVIELLSKRRKEENWNGIIVVCLDNCWLFEKCYLFIYYIFLFVLVFTLGRHRYLASAIINSPKSTLLEI